MSKTNKVKDRRLRILWVSNSHWCNSGYGVFTRDLLFRLRDDGWPIAEAAFYGLDGNPIEVDKIKVYPKMGDAWGSDSLFHSAMDFKANVAFSMQDIGFLQPQFLDLLMKNKIQWIPEPAEKNSEFPKMCFCLQWWPPTKKTRHVKAFRKF